VIALVGGYLILSDTKKKKEEFGLRTEQQMNADIESANKIKEARENENAKRLDTAPTARQAQENYVRGFRDYRKGQYERALESFQACLALDPSHVLCNRYLRLSQRKFNEMVQYYVLLGRKYRDQNQFASCRAAFRNVMVMVKDANNETYKLAKANYEACNAFIEGRF
jgi:tetratricopeptide (TPR) repeat protein